MRLLVLLVALALAGCLGSPESAGIAAANLQEVSSPTCDGVGYGSVMIELSAAGPDNQIEVLFGSENATRSPPGETAAMWLFSQTHRTIAMTSRFDNYLITQDSDQGGAVQLVALREYGSAGRGGFAVTIDGKNHSDEPFLLVAAGAALDGTPTEIAINATGAHIRCVSPFASAGPVTLIGPMQWSGTFLSAGDVGKGATAEVEREAGFSTDNGTLAMVSRGISLASIQSVRVSNSTWSGDWDGIQYAAGRGSFTVHDEHQLPTFFGITGGADAWKIEVTASANTEDYLPYVIVVDTLLDERFPSLLI